MSEKTSKKHRRQFADALELCDQLADLADALIDALLVTLDTAHAMDSAQARVASRTRGDLADLRAEVRRLRRQSQKVA